MKLFIIFFVFAGVANPPPASCNNNDCSGHKSPQDAYNAFSDAFQREDIVCVMHSFTENTQQDIAITIYVKSIVVMAFLELASEEKGVESEELKQLKELRARHGLLAKDYEDIENVISNTTTINQFVTEIYSFLKSDSSSNTKRKNPFGNLKDLRIKGDPAIGVIDITVDSETKDIQLDFKKINAAWYLNTDIVNYDIRITENKPTFRSIDRNPTSF